MHPFSSSPPTRPHRLLLALLVGASLIAGCGKDDSAALLAEARTMIAAGDYKAAAIQLKNAISQDADNAEARFELGKLQLDLGDFASAEKELRRARQAGYDEKLVNPLLARALIGQGEFKRVLEELPQPATNTPGDVPMLVVRATAQIGAGDRDDARKTLERASTAAPTDAEVLLAQARLAAVDGDTARAGQLVDQALQQNPRHRDAWLFKADLLRATGTSADAAKAYEGALNIDPDHAGARLALAGLAITDNRLADARREVDTVLKAQHNHLQARYTLALIEFREKNPEAARDRLAEVLKAAPNYSSALLLAGSAEYALGNMQSAESHLNKAIQAAPRNPYALRLLAATQLRQNRADDAARTLTGIPANAHDAGYHMVAGEVALARRDFAKAAMHFEQAAQISPDNAAIRTELGIARLAKGDDRAMADLQAAAAMEGGGSRADTAIILTQLNKRNFDAALASIDALEKKQGPSPLSWNYRGAAQLGKNDPVRARQSFAQALKLDPKFFPAAANLAQLDLQDKKPDAARQRFEAVLKTDPKNQDAMLALADLALRARDEAAFVGWLEKAAAAHPQSIRPRVTLARYQLGRGERTKALATAREAVNAEPTSAIALDVLGAVQVALGDTANALATYRKVAELSNNAPAALTKLAAVQTSSQQFADARKSLESALRTQPDLLDAQLLLARLDLQAGRPDDALKIARQIQQQKPQSAAGATLEGDILVARKQYGAALAAFERAQTLEPLGTLLIRQHDALAALGRPEEGEKRLAGWLAKHPQDASVRMALAERLLKRGQFKAAADHYLNLNKSTPNNLVVLNNLAWSLHEAGDKRALHYAEQALKLQPDNPAVMDTTGWIMVQQGQAERGLRLLQQALSKAPDSGEIHYHLAAAYAKTGDAARARSELERLLRSGITFAQERDARALLNELQGATR